MRRSLLSLSLLVPLFATPARATVAWTATTEMNNLSEWGPATNGTKTLPNGMVRKNIEPSGERVYTGNYAVKCTVHPDDTFGQYVQDRADIKHESTLTGEGKDSYLSGFYFLPEDAKTRMEIAFYETKVTSRNWMDLWVEPKVGGGGGTTVKFGIESQGANLGSVLLWTGDWQAGKWHQFAIHVHWSTDATKGLVNVWFDGQQVITNRKHKTKFDNNDMFYQTGLHRVTVQPFTETIYFDDFIEADTLAEIKVGAAGPGVVATDGGVDATGAAGTGGGTDGGAGTTAAAGTGGGAGTGGAAGTGVAGTTGAAGTSGGAGTNGAAGTSGAAGTTSPPADDSEGGCACSTGGNGPASLLSVFALLGLVLKRRRIRS